MLIQSPYDEWRKGFIHSGLLDIMSIYQFYIDDDLEDKIDILKYPEILNVYPELAAFIAVKYLEDN